MRLGVMSTVLARPTIEEVAAAVLEAGLEAVQLNLELASLEALPAELDEAVCARIRAAFEAHHLEISAVSGTFNAIHPDRAYREECIRRVGVLASRCALLGTEVITLCTGTRNRESMWRYHPDNAAPEAWAELVETMRRLIDYAEENSVTMAFEPEVVNVVDTAEKAERLIDEVGSNRLAVVMDPANYFQPHTLDQMQEVLADVFARVGEFIVLAHAKDVRGPEPGGRECIRPAAGNGVLDYPFYLRLLRDSGYDGALIMHSLEEHEVPRSRDYLRRHLAAIGWE